jgi:hypothetical protein
MEMWVTLRMACGNGAVRLGERSSLWDGLLGRAVSRLTSLPSDFTRDSHRSAERLNSGAQANACPYPRLATQIMQRVLRM